MCPAHDAEMPTAEAASPLAPPLENHFAIWLSPQNLNFALSELLAVCEALGEPFEVLPWSTDVALHSKVIEDTRRARQLYHDGCDHTQHVHDANWPEWTFPLIRLYLPGGVDSMKRIAARCIAIKQVWVLWAEGSTVESLVEQLRRPESVQQRQRYADPELSLKMELRTLHWQASTEERKAWFHDILAASGLEGPIKMRDPDLLIGLVASFSVPPSGVTRANAESSTRPRLELAFVGPVLDCKLGRELIDTFDVKKRLYIGNTTMESEMSLRMSLMALAVPGRTVYDPFAGTGSTLHTSAAYGAHVLGSELDGRMLRGSDEFADFSASRKRHGKDANSPSQVEARTTGIIETAKLYGLRDKVVDTVIMDFTQMAWRHSLLQQDGLFDAIVTDPPYGVRAGAKKLGRRPDNTRSDAPAEGSSDRTAEQDYIPPKQPYHLEDLLSDLLDKSAALLKDGGRLVFFLPSMSEEEQRTELPPHPDFELIARNGQAYNKWERILITLRRRPRGQSAATDVERKQPSHGTQFRDLFFGPNNRRVA